MLFKRKPEVEIVIAFPWRWHDHYDYAKKIAKNARVIANQILTVKGWRAIDSDDWIIAKPNGKSYFCKEADFRKLYEEHWTDDMIADRVKMRQLWRGIAPNAG